MSFVTAACCVQTYDPVLSWAQSAIGTTFTVSDSIFGTTQADNTIQAVQNFLEGERGLQHCRMPTFQTPPLLIL